MKIVGLLALVLAAALALTACAPVAPSPPPATTAAPTVTESTPLTRITPDQLAQMLAEPERFLVVNVHIPYEGELAETDLAIPFDQIDALLGELPDKDAQIVVYCRSGRMSDIAAQRLVELGYGHVYDLVGGMIAWEASGRSLLNR